MFVVRVQFQVWALVAVRPSFLRYSNSPFSASRFCVVTSNLRLKHGR